jgi:Beta-lactamase
MLVALVSHHDDVNVETLGHLASRKRDTIFRIASITKLVAAVAAMILVENVRYGSTVPSSRICQNLQIATCSSPSLLSLMTRYLHCAQSPF